MLHIIGLILKIIGIILLVILGLLVSLICIVLLVPVRYEISAEFPGKIDEITGRLRVSWLLHLFGIRADYADGKLDFYMRVAWKKFTEKESSDEAAEDVKNVIEEMGSNEAKPDGAEEVKSLKTSKKQEDQVSAEVSESETGDAQARQKRTAAEDSVKSSKEGDGTEDDESGESNRKPGKKKNIIRRISEKVRAVFDKIKYTIMKMYGKIKEALKKSSELKEKVTAFIEDEVHRSAFARIKKEMVWIRRFLKPKKLRMNLHFGFEDPYHTGQALAAMSMIYPYVGEHMSIEPDFENRVLEGSLYIKGNLRAFHLFMLVVKVAIDRNVWKTYRHARDFRKS